MTAFDNYRDAIALLRGTIPYKETQPEAYESASAHCKATWQAWQVEQQAELSAAAENDPTPSPG